MSIISLEEKKKMSKITLDELLKSGGEWLEEMRSWIQRKARNGEKVTWGSSEFLELPPLTVFDMEMLAHFIALQAINWDRERNRNEDVKYQRALESLTPGGSEFAGEIETCLKWIREQMDKKKLLKRIKELENK